MNHYGIIFTNLHVFVLLCFVLFCFLIQSHEYQSTVVMLRNHILFHGLNSSYYNFAFLDQILKLQHGRGICSVFILDTSESMSGEGLRQMKEALICILNGMFQQLFGILIILLYIWTIISQYSIFTVMIR